MKTKDTRGITLVALVITIVVLLILVGISINLVLGDNGIITKAQEARIAQELSSYKENMEPLNKFKTINLIRAV